MAKASCHIKVGFGHFVVIMMKNDNFPQSNMMRSSLLKRIQLHFFISWRAVLEFFLSPLFTTSFAIRRPLVCWKLVLASPRSKTMSCPRGWPKHEWVKNGNSSFCDRDSSTQKGCSHFWANHAWERWIWVTWLDKKFSCFQGKPTSLLGVGSHSAQGVQDSKADVCSIVRVMPFVMGGCMHLLTAKQWQGCFFHFWQYTHVFLVCYDCMTPFLHSLTKYTVRKALQKIQYVKELKKKINNPQKRNRRLKKLWVALGKKDAGICF